MSTNNLLARLHTGPVSIQVKDVKVIKYPASEDLPARTVLVYKETKFYLAPNRDGTVNGVGYYAGVPVRIVIDKVMSQKWVWNENAKDYILTESPSTRIYLELQDDYSTRDTTTYWLYYATLSDIDDEESARIISCWPAQFSSINEADNVIAVLMNRGDGNTSVYDFHPPCDTIVVEQTTAMTLFDVEHIARTYLLDIEAVSEEELQDQLDNSL